MKKTVQIAMSLLLSGAMILGSSARLKAQYCTPTYFQGCATGVEINDFSITGDAGTSISDLATGCSSAGTLPVTCYRDMSASMSVTMTPGSTYTITTDATAMDIFPTGVQVFIDFDDNGSFDPGESVGGGTMGLLGLSTTISITIPTGVATGSHRMRVVASGDLTYPSITPCPSFSFTGGGSSTTGEVHDYTAVIGTASGCSVPTGLAASAITTTSATISWTEPIGSVGSEYIVTTSPGLPTGSGTQTTLLVDNESGLTPGTVYYVWVRDSCDVSSLSSWVTITFTTTATTTSCAPVTGLTASSITSSSAVLNWTAVSGSVGYLWAVDMSPADPTSGWTFTSLNTATATGLTASTTYYAHVKDSCSSGNSSTWVTIPLTTTSIPTGISSTTPNGNFALATYPNPVGNELTIAITGGAASGVITLTDISGKTILQQTVSNGVQIMLLDQIPAGIYILKYSDAGHSQVKMVKKQ